jgi:hypothetical protein
MKMRKMIALTLAVAVMAAAPAFAKVPDNGQHQELEKGKGHPKPPKK